jgi:hypothetical protein
MRRQTTPIVDRKKHILDLISPVSNLMSLRGSPSTQVNLMMNSVEMFILCSLCYFNVNIMLQSPLTGHTFSGTPAGRPKKLFAEPEVSSTQDKMQELLGQFTG